MELNVFNLDIFTGFLSSMTWPVLPLNQDIIEFVEPPVLHKNLTGFINYFNKRLVGKKERLRKTLNTFLPKKPKIIANKVNSLAARVSKRSMPGRNADFELLKRQSCVNDRTDNRRELAMRLYMENNYQSVRNWLHEDDYQGQLTTQMNTALTSLLRSTKTLNVRSPEVTYEITPPAYTAFQIAKVLMHSNVKVVPPTERTKPATLLNSLAPEVPEKVPSFRRKTHVSVNFIYRPTFLLVEE
jgi:hypothetical protein